jgi:hypothetical protein
MKKILLAATMLGIAFILTACTATTTKTNLNNSTQTSGTTGSTINACQILTVEEATSAFGSPMTRYSPAEGITSEVTGSNKSYGCTYVTPDSTGLIEISIYRFFSASAARTYYDDWNGHNSGVAVTGYGEAAYWGAANAVMGTIRGSDYITVEALVGKNGDKDKAAAAMTIILKNLQ